MSKQSHYIKPAKRTTSPAHVASVVVSTRDADAPVSSSGRPTVFESASLAWSRRRGASWSRAGEETALSGRALLARLETLAPRRGVLWVVSPSASSSLVLCGFLPLLLERGAQWSGRKGTTPEGSPPFRPVGFEPDTSAAGSPSPAANTKPATDPFVVSAFVTSGKPDIIRYHTKGKTIVWVSGPQYFTSSERSLAELCGYTYRYGFEGDGLYLTERTNPADSAALWLTLFQQFGDWWREIDGGPFAPTPAGLSMSYVRKRLKPRTVLSCQDPEIRKLEEASIYGGRASTWCYAPVVRSYSDGADCDELKEGRPFRAVLGPLDHYDVKSMYPTLLATCDYPTRYLHTYNRPTCEALADMLQRWCVIASVKLSSTEGEYPMRRPDRISYPRGTWTTTLTTPELRRALTDGAVVECYRAQTYLRGRPFGDAFDSLLALRKEAHDAGQKAREEFVKLLSNAFGGKLAQRSHEWQRRPGVTALLDWGEWPARDLLTGEWKHFRSRAGLVDEKVRAELPTRPLAACFAHLTAYGRDAMRLIRAGLPARSVVSQDTDGLWCLRSKVSKRDTIPPLPEYPKLTCRHNKTTIRGRWYGPRHYWTDQGWTLAGMHDPARWGDGLSFADSYRRTPVNTGVPIPPVWVYECQRYVRLGDIPVDGRCDRDGWITPPATWCG